MATFAADVMAFWTALGIDTYVPYAVAASIGLGVFGAIVFRRR